jgi:hypothetical protein
MLKHGLYMSGGLGLKAIATGHQHIFMSNKAYGGLVGAKKLSHLNKMRIRIDHEERRFGSGSLQRHHPGIRRNDGESFLARPQNGVEFSSHPGVFDLSGYFLSSLNPGG